MEEKKQKSRKPIQVLRERMGGMSDELKAYYKNQTQFRKKLSEVLASGPHTIPEIVGKTGLDSAEVTWHVMAMKKYDQVVETKRDGVYYRYTLKEAPDGS